MNFRKRAGAKLQMKCHQCRQACATKDGDWHNGLNNQIFLCRACETKGQLVRYSSRVRPVLASVTA